MKLATKIVFGTVLVLAVAGLSYTAGAKGKGPAPVTWPAADVKWEPYAPGAPLQVGQLWGDRNKGEHGMYLKLPAGFEAGMHSHTADYYAVLVQGTWVHTNEGDTAAPKELTPGSYVFQPGKQNHNDVCKSKTDCIIFVYQHAKGDFIPVKAPEKAAEKAAPKAPEKTAEKAAPKPMEKAAEKVPEKTPEKTVVKAAEKK